MKAFVCSLVAALLFQFQFLSAQERCSTVSYMEACLSKDPALAIRIKEAEQKKINSASRIFTGVVKIPVVVHNLYHLPEEKISDVQVLSQIEALNTYFRKRNADTAGIPSYFRSLAADCEIEFQLAISDPRKRSTSGIIRKYTPVTSWGPDDKMKFSTEMGDDAWDSKSYLNIWVCNMDKYAGYAAVPGSEAAKDGIVISYKSFGVTSSGSYGMGKTAVHEVAHWLGLKHIWGDAYCGDDGIDDTPKQASYTTGCPSAIRITCGNAPYGDMYMNFMDLTNDLCLKMFTTGQKEKMRSFFEPGGVRESLLYSKGLNMPLISEIPVPTEDPKWLEPKIYPNPATNELKLDLAYDIRWIGEKIFVTNIVGQNIINLIVTSKSQTIDISKLQPGTYFLAAKRTDGLSMKLKFVKL